MTPSRWFIHPILIFIFSVVAVTTSLILPPVTSLKLYLETFRRHALPREDQIKYVDYMIQDAERLSDNIMNPSTTTQGAEA